MGETLYDALYKLYFEEKDPNLFFEKYKNFALNFLEKRGFTSRIDYHSCQDLVQNASMDLLKFKIKNGEKYYPKNLFIAMCFNAIKYAAYHHLDKDKKYAGDVEEYLVDEATNDRYFPTEMSEKAIRLIETYELEKVREALILYFFDDLTLKDIARMTGLWYRGLKHLINIFIIEMKNELTNDNISIEDYLRDEAPKTIFTQRRLREYIKRKTL
jgi:RNA polymerase sigma factor (sigma-70 family)